QYDLPGRRDRVLANQRVDRAILCGALEKMNRNWGAGEETLQHIARLGESDCIAVVTGQQAGLFGGPLYTIYKALSAVKLAECMTQRGFKAVPVFWIATEDHDFAEVATAGFINRDCDLSHVGVPLEMHRDEVPVGRVTLNESIRETTQNLIEALPQTEFSDYLEKLLHEAYEPGRKYGDAFAWVMTALTSQHGLILLDPLDSQLKRLAA